MLFGGFILLAGSFLLRRGFFPAAHVENPGKKEALVQNSLVAGRYVWEAMSLSRSQFEKQLSPIARSQNNFVILLKSINCMSCYNFHIEQVQMLSAAFNIPIIVLGNSQYCKYVKADLPSALIVPIRKWNGSDFVILLADDQAKILNVDFPDPERYHESKIFYSRIESLLSSIHHTPK